MRSKRLHRLDGPRSLSLVNYPIILRLATTDVVISFPRASCLDYPIPMTSLRRCALITTPFLMLNWNLRLVLDAVLVIQRLLAVLWIWQLANADVAF